MIMKSTSLRVFLDMTTVKDEAKSSSKNKAPAKSKVATKPAAAAAVTKGQAERVLKPLHTASSLKALSAALPKDSMGKTDLYTIDPDLLQVRPNWNSRGAFLSLEEFLALPSSVAYIRQLADAYKAGKQVPALIVVVINGVPYIVDGHFRRMAIKLANSEGAQIKRVSVIQATGDEDQQRSLVHTTQDNMKLSVIDKAKDYGDYVTRGWNIAEIAKLFGVEYETVRITLQYLDLPVELLKLIQQQVVKAYYARKLYLEHGEEKAIELISAGVGENKKGKVTPRNVKKATGLAAPKPNKKLVEAMRTGLTSITDRLSQLNIAQKGDRFQLEFSRAEVESLLSLKDELEALKQKSESIDPETETDQQQLALH